MDIRHAYEKMTGVVNKPSFDLVYNRVHHFVEPFVIGVSRDVSWNGRDWA